MAIAAGAMSPDPERFPVVWMGHEALAAAFQLSGASAGAVTSMPAAFCSTAARTRSRYSSWYFSGLNLSVESCSISLSASSCSTGLNGTFVEYSTSSIERTSSA